MTCIFWLGLPDASPGRPRVGGDFGAVEEAAGMTAPPRGDAGLIRGRRAARRQARPEGREVSGTGTQLVAARAWAGRVSHPWLSQ
jgi:hypothetical protein